jgi:hypothetical protein
MRPSSGSMDTPGNDDTYLHVHTRIQHMHTHRPIPTAACKPLQWLLLCSHLRMCGRSFSSCPALITCVCRCVIKAWTVVCFVCVFCVCGTMYKDSPRLVTIRSSIMPVVYKPHGQPTGRISLCVCPTVRRGTFTFVPPFSLAIQDKQLRICLRVSKQNFTI